MPSHRNEALTPEFKRLREAEIERAYAEAAADPLFQQDMAETEAAWSAVSADGLRGAGDEDLEP